MGDDVAIKVSEVYKSFRLPHEKQSSIKSLLVNIFKRKTYEKQQVLSDINFEIKKGEFFGIVGRNGGGKSTMLKLLAGIYSPDKGGIVVNGKLTAFIELGVGFNPELTGRENVYLSGALLGFSEKEVDAMYKDIVDFAELPRFMDQKLKNYSSGMQVRLAFSIAIRAKSDILILDEVLAVGDAAFQQKCYDYFEELKSQGQTVVFVSHDMGAVRRFCSRAIYIQEGKVVLDGSPEDISMLYAEKNINDETTNESKNILLGLPKNYSINTKITKENKELVQITITYKAEQNEPLYIGVAIIKDGISIGEITTPHSAPLRGEGIVKYTFDKTILNAGVYQIGGASLFRLKNRELVAVTSKRQSFSVEGDDITRGAAMKLADSWNYDED